MEVSLAQARENGRRIGGVGGGRSVVADGDGEGDGPTHTLSECIAIKEEGLRSYDRAILNRWDKEMTRQQQSLEDLGIPTFYPTSERLVLERQYRILEEVDVILGEEGTGEEGGR